MAPALESTVAARLGGEVVLGRSVTSMVDLAGLVHDGLPIAAWEFVRRSSRFVERELDAVIPQRTLRHRKLKGQRLTPEESDRAVRLLRVQALAERTFDDEAKADRWLRRELHVLDGQRPIDLVNTEAGARLIETLLEGIAWGAAA
jgi:putative toxin-antitoxin system antitoxin component (TIGR02293 family)